MHRKKNKDRFTRKAGVIHQPAHCQRLEYRQSPLVTAYWSIVGIAIFLIMTTQPALAAETATIWTKFSSMMQDLYGKIVMISTIVAVTAASVALIVRMVSRNQRAIEEATSWLKRIVVTWVMLNTLGFFVAYIQPLVEGGAYKAK